MSIAASDIQRNGRLPPPRKMPLNPDLVPKEIRDLPRWVAWKWIWSAKKNKYGKPPLQVSGKKARSNDSSTWTTFERASMATAGNRFSGVGFVLGTDVGIVGVDLDDCRNPETGAVSEPAASIIRELDSYAEVSPSGTGVKLLLRGTIPPKAAKVNHAAGIEVYDNGRYFTITSHRLPDAPLTINERQQQCNS